VDHLDTLKLFYAFFCINYFSWYCLKPAHLKMPKKGVSGSIVDSSVKVAILTFSFDCCLSERFGFVHTEEPSQGWASWRLRQSGLNRADVSPAEPAKGRLLGGIITARVHSTYHLLLKNESRWMLFSLKTRQEMSSVAPPVYVVASE